jgi:hypothetical protein
MRRRWVEGCFREGDAFTQRRSVGTDTSRATLHAWNGMRCGAEVYPTSSEMTWRTHESGFDSLAPRARLALRAADGCLSRPSRWPRLSPLCFASTTRGLRADAVAPGLVCQHPPVLPFGLPAASYLAPLGSLRSARPRLIWNAPSVLGSAGSAGLTKSSAAYNRRETRGAGGRGHTCG